MLAIWSLIPQNRSGQDVTDETCVQVQDGVFNIFFFFCHIEAFWILFPQPGMESVPPTVEAQSLNHWTAREFPLAL